MKQSRRELLRQRKQLRREKDRNCQRSRQEKYYIEILSFDHCEDSYDPYMESYEKDLIKLRNVYYRILKGPSIWELLEPETHEHEKESWSYEDQEMKKTYKCNEITCPKSFGISQELYDQMPDEWEIYKDNHLPSCLFQIHHQWTCLFRIYLKDLRKKEWEIYKGSIEKDYFEPWEPSEFKRLRPPKTISLVRIEKIRMNIKPQYYRWLLFDPIY